MKKRMKWLVVLLVLVAAVGLVIVSQSRNSDAPGKVFRFNNSAEPKTLDPALMRGTPELTIALGLFEGLTAYDPQTLKPIPGIAERWELSKDLLTYTFHLRDSSWSNGDPLTAADFLYAWQRVLDPATASEYANQLWYIKNAAAYTDGKLKDFSKVGVRVIDPKTIEITLENPTPYFLELLAFATYMPVNKACVERYGEEWARPGHMVSNGPFVLAEWKDRQVVLERNPLYWRAGDVHLDRIVASSIDNDDTAFRQYQFGDLDWLRSVPDAAVNDLKSRPDYYATSSLGTHFYRFNCSRKPFDDPRVRKAFSLAVDQTKICKYTLYDQFQPADSLVPHMFDDYKSPDGLGYDPKRAAELLAEAGYPGGKGFPPVNLILNRSVRHQAVAEMALKMWKENLGIDVSLVVQEWSSYLNSMKLQNYDMIRAAWIGDYVDPYTFLDLFTSTNKNNQTGWVNAQYDALVLKAAQTADRPARAKLMQDAERILIQDDVPVLLLYFDSNIGLLRQNVKGFHLNSRNIHPFQAIDIQ